MQYSVNLIVQITTPVLSVALQALLVNWPYLILTDRFTNLKTYFHNSEIQTNSWSNLYFNCEYLNLLYTLLFTFVHFTLF
jgi:hypothetical protein